MTEEQIKNWAREKANALEENQTLGIYDRDEDMRYDEGYNDGQVSGYEEGLIDGYHEGFQDCAKSRLNVTTISDCPIKDEWHYVKNGVYPTDDKKVLCILGDFENDNLEVGYYSQVEGDSKRWRFENYDLPDDSEECWGVSAWKEIVLPELPKESE